MLKSVKNPLHLTKRQILPYLAASSINKPRLENYNSLLSEMISYALTLYLRYIYASCSMNIFQGNTLLNIWLHSEDV